MPHFSGTQNYGASPSLRNPCIDLRFQHIQRQRSFVQDRVDVRDASRILLHPVHQPFEASATSIAYEPAFFERMRVLPSL
jgi:hypothetical protein